MEKSIEGKTGNEGEEKSTVIDVQGKRNKKCEDRIDEELKRRIQEFENALNQAEKNEDGFEIEECEYEDFIDWINQNILAYSEDPHARAMRLELSYGGPQDYFLFYDDDTIEYHYLDWFDGAERELHGKNYDIMSRVKNYLTP